MNVRRRKEMHHSKHCVLLGFCQKYIIKTLLVSLFEEASACEM